MSLATDFFFINKLVAAQLIIKIKTEDVSRVRVDTGILVTA